MTSEKNLEFEIQILAGDTTDEELDNLTRNLLAELRKTDVESVSLVSAGAAPKGTKGEAELIGKLALEVLPTAVPALIAIIQGWIMRGQNRIVKFKGKGFEFEGSPEELEKLLKTLNQGKKK